jgi:Apea-like HEPN
MGSTQGNRTRKLNSILHCVCDADVNLYYILGTSIPETFQCEIPPFRFGRLRVEKLRYQCEKAESDFYKRYSDILCDAWVTERAPKSVRVLDMPLIRELAIDIPMAQSGSDWRPKVWASLLEGYFALQNKFLFDDFWIEVVYAQDTLFALGGPFSDPRALRSLIQCLQVAIFLNAGSSRFGFVAPAGSGPITMDLANAHVRVPRLFRELRQQYHFEQFDNSALHGSIKLFASFVAQARRHQINGYPDEALLHFVIALELIFGDRKSIQKSVVQRVALVTFHHVDRSFEQHCVWLNQIYDLRSRYVHAGERLTDHAVIDAIYDLCQQVFRCLLRLQAAHRSPSERGETTLTQWMAFLDYLVAKCMVPGKPIDGTEFQEAFII